MQKLILILLLCLSAIFLGLSLRGHLGNPTAQELNTSYWKDDGPLELSPERGRFALLYSLAEDHSFHFSLPIARFATPDLAYSNGNYVSLFAPAVSFFVAPGYLIGKALGASQAGAVSVISIFSLINLFLIYLITFRFTRNLYASLLAGFTFLFASPAFTYAVTIYQHHISTFLILSSLYLFLRWNNLWSLTLIWFIIALAIPTDYPNLIFLLPLAVYATGRFFTIIKDKEKTTLNFHYYSLITVASTLIPLAFFLWFNAMSYNNPLQLSGTLKSVKEIKSDGNPATPEELAKMDGKNFDPADLNRKKTVTGFFQSRNLLNGFYIHSISPDRGVLIYTPVVLFGISGLVVLWKKKYKYLPLIVGIIGATILLYSMWGDPWGGWAFGSRYLIPVYALLAIGIGIGLDHFKKQLLFISIFWVIFLYSVSVNSLGALTTSRIPPQIEALALEKVSHQQERYSYDRNYQMILNNQSKSLVWQEFLNKYFTAQQYYISITIAISLTGATLLLLNYLKKKEEITR